MRTISWLTKSVLVLAALAGLQGCGGNLSAGSHGAASNAPAGHDHEHGHEHMALHGGHLVDLGRGKYHAELTHDDASHKVSVYVLDASAKRAVPIDAETVTINWMAGNRPTQSVLSAAPQTDDPPGAASRYELVSEALCSGCCAPGAAARLNVLIDGRPYMGEIEAHDHAAGHGHSHAGDDALVWREEVGEPDCRIALGHHGRALRAGHEVEPAVQITCEGRPVADARVFNALLGTDGRTVLAEEVSTVYEPPTDEEPAHYAQGSLQIPAGLRSVVIRYRIVLPEGGGERAFDLPVAVD